MLTPKNMHHGCFMLARHASKTQTVKSQVNWRVSTLITCTTMTNYDKIWFNRYYSKSNILLSCNCSLMKDNLVGNSIIKDVVCFSTLCIKVTVWNYHDCFGAFCGIHVSNLVVVWWRIQDRLPRPPPPSVCNNHTVRMNILEREVCGSYPASMRGWDIHFWSIRVPNLVEVWFSTQNRLPRSLPSVCSNYTVRVKVFQLIQRSSELLHVTCTCG